MKRNKICILPAIDNCNGDISKKWFVFFSYRDPRNGKMKRFKIYTGLHKFKTIPERTAAANKLCQQYRERLANGFNPFTDDEKSIYEDQLQYNNVALIYGKHRASNKTVRFFASCFLLHLNEGNKLEHETITTYTSKYRTFNLWLQKNGFEDDDISCIDNNIILAFFDYLINERKLSGNSISKYTQNLRALFNYARQQKAIIVNPVYDIPLCRRVNDMAPRPIADFDIQKFKDEIYTSDPQLWLAISFEYYCFLRPGKELRLLKICDIDFARGIVDVDRFRAKTNMERFPTIPLVFLNELREVYKLHTFPKHFYVFGKNYEPSKDCIGKNNLRYRFRDVREKLNMPDSYKFYSWKHTGNGRASDAGISLSSLQEQNGHTSIKTTEIYLRHKIGKVDKEIRDYFPQL